MVVVVDVATETVVFVVAVAVVAIVATHFVGLVGNGVGAVRVGVCTCG